MNRIRARGARRAGAKARSKRIKDAMSSDAGQLRKRSVLIAGHHTSVSLENAFWAALKRIADARGLSVNGLITEIDRGRSANLSSAIRVFVLENRGGGG